VNGATGIDPGFARGADDGVGDIAEYRSTTDPASTTEMIAMPANTSVLVVSEVAIRPP
jgi:hypothetical protein